MAPGRRAAMGGHKGGGGDDDGQLVDGRDVWRWRLVRRRNRRARHGVQVGSSR